MYVVFAILAWTLFYSGARPIMDALPPMFYVDWTQVTVPWMLGVFSACASYATLPRTHRLFDLYTEDEEPSSPYYNRYGYHETIKPYDSMTQAEHEECARFWNYCQGEEIN